MALNGNVSLRFSQRSSFLISYSKIGSQNFEKVAYSKSRTPLIQNILWIDYETSNITPSVYSHERYNEIMHCVIQFLDDKYISGNIAQIFDRRRKIFTVHYIYLALMAFKSAWKMKNWPKNKNLSAQKLDPQMKDL